MKSGRTFRISLIGITLVLAIAATGLTQDLKPIKLPPAETSGGMPLMEALSLRQTGREYSPEKLSPQVMSNLLWAAFGINRKDTGKRTAPSAMNWQETDIYVALEEGLYLYNAADQVLEPVLAEDLRADTGKQPFVAGAPVNLVFVSDYSRMSRVAEEQKATYAAADVGFISQNVYLYCASAGLATVVRGYVDKEALAKKMGLREDQKVVLAQTVGYPPAPVEE
ncbi:MAG: SagB/ThcOx family dehydrogenase [bacterium]